MKTPETHQIKRAIISVSDKKGLIEFAKSLTELGVEIFSTGGTAKALKNENISVKSVSELTGFPEILDGRVKTLHPAVHAGLLADLGKEEHVNQLEKQNLVSIDLLVVNLYPFENTLEKEGVSHAELIENIDIGGPTMLRSAAKNYKWTAVVVNPDNYSDILDQMKANGNCLTESYRAKLAGDVFSHTAHYDSLISNYFINFNKIETPDRYSISMPLDQTLRYGENPHQKAALYGKFNNIFKKVHGKELSFNNIIDINAASSIVIEFDEPACVIVKHTNPCGIAMGSDISEAFNFAFEIDKVSPFGGIIAVNRPMDLKAAETMHSLFTEVIIAPEFTPEAIELLTKKKDRRLIVAKMNEISNAIRKDIRSVAGGLLVQDADREMISSEGLKVVTKRQPTEDEMKALLIGWTACKHVKSNAIVYSAKNRILAVGAGQMSRVDSSRIAVEKAELNGISLQGSVIASDAYFPFADGLIQAAEAGATAAIQPGGSVRDAEVIAAADERNIAMVFTGMRHFKH